MAIFKKNTIAALEEQAQTAQDELTAAEAAFASAVQSMETPPIELTDDQIGDLVGVKNLAEVRLVKARAAHRRADHALTEAQKAAAEKERKDELARVHSMGTAAQKQMTDAVMTATKQLRAAMRSMAEAELAREALNAKLPDDQQIPDFEIAVMNSPSVPRKDISRTRELHWLRSSSDPYGPEYTRQIKENADGTAMLSVAGRSEKLFRRRYFDRVTYSDWKGFRGASSLASALALPGLKGAPAGWSPLRYVTPRAVLDELDRVEAYVYVEEGPEIKEEMVVASPIFEDAEALKAWDAEQHNADEAA